MQNHLTRPPFERRTSPRGRPDGRGIGNGVEESPDSRKQRCRVTPGRGNPTDSATEIRPPSHRSGNRNHGAVRVKRWGKSPPRRWQQGWHGKPHREQCQIGPSRGQVPSGIPPLDRLWSSGVGLAARGAWRQASQRNGHRTAATRRTESGLQALRAPSIIGPAALSRCPGPEAVRPGFIFSEILPGSRPHRATGAAPPAPPPRETGRRPHRAR